MNLPSRRKSETCYSQLRLWLQNKIHFVTHLYINICNWIVGGSRKLFKSHKSLTVHRLPCLLYTKYYRPYNALNVLRHGLMLYVNIYIQYTLWPPSRGCYHPPSLWLNSLQLIWHPTYSTLIWGFSSYKMIALKQRNGRETPSEPTLLDLQLTSESTRLSFILYDWLWSTKHIFYSKFNNVIRTHSDKNSLKRSVQFKRVWGKINS